MNIAQATIKVKEQFELAGRKYMEETLKLGEKLRPQYFRDFFLFPDCYNYQNYLDPGCRGKCPNTEIERNNNLGWIWEESTALYPATYLKSKLKSSPNAKLYNRYRVVEGIRISKVREENNPLPVFLYTCIAFFDRIWEFLSLVSKLNNCSYVLLCRNSVNRNAMLFKSVIQLYVSFRNTDISSSMISEEGKISTFLVFNIIWSVSSHASTAKCRKYFNYSPPLSPPLLGIWVFF